VKLDVNHFPVELTLKQLYHYDVQIQKLRPAGDGESQKQPEPPRGNLPRRVARQVSLAMRGGRVVYILALELLQWSRIATVNITILSLA